MILIIGGKSQGKKAFAEKEFPGYRVVEQYQETVRKQMLDGLDPMREAEKLLSQGDGQLVIITDEIGCGVVPMDPWERAYRETDGRVNCYLAEHAESVYRVLAGIEMKIK
jgi:adenosylcobinamide kinase/adenosylcobinamide-phosphate guanylyltransferase